MNRRRLSLVVGSAAGVLCLNGWAAGLLEPSAWAAGERLGQWLAEADSAPALPRDVDWEALEGETAVPAPEPAAAPNAPAPSRGKVPASAPRDGALFVSRERVLALSRHASMPASRYVPARGRRPAGLQVAGVSGLGIGVRDGDVLTKVAGVAVQSSAAVISTVLRLRAQKAPMVSGEFWRGDQRWSIAFEMPYLDGSGAAAAPTAAGAATAAPAGSTPALRAPTDAVPGAAAANPSR